jgi:hypothetical protein
MGALISLRFRRSALAALMTIALTACTGPKGVPGAENRSVTVATGAAVGAVLGAIAGALTGDERAVIAGMGAGAALGAGLGLLVARNNEQAALTEQQLAERTTAARGEASAYAASANATRRELAALQREIDRTKAQYQQGRMNEREYNARMGAFAQQFEGIQGRATATQATIERYQADAAAARRGGLNATAMEQAVQEMSATNQGVRGALDDVQRSLIGRG